MCLSLVGPLEFARKKKTFETAKQFVLHVLLDLLEISEKKVICSLFLMAEVHRRDMKDPHNFPYIQIWYVVLFITGSGT